MLNVADPTGDDNGPGTYQYPTSTDFTAGSFDLTHFAVSQDGTNVYIETSLRTLVSTFGSTFGAQLLDIYVHAPGAATTSTASAYPGNMNYTIASPWSERLEAQGFASPVWVDAAGDSLGTAQFVTDTPSATATLILPESTFGTVGSGWTFTVALTGQDGTHFPPTRDFTQPASGVHVRRMPYERHHRHVLQQPGHGAEGNGHDRAVGPVVLGDHTAGGAQPGSQSGRSRAAGRDRALIGQPSVRCEQPVDQA